MDKVKVAELVKLAKSLVSKKTYELLRDVKTKKGSTINKGDRLPLVEWGNDYPYAMTLEAENGQVLKVRAPTGHRLLKRFPKPPSDRLIDKWIFDGIAKSVDGKRVENDGFSSSGAPSWLLALGMI